MDPMLDAQRRCLHALHDACAAQPLLHAHQLLALDRERALAADATDLDGYRGRSGDGFELIRAGRLDRIAGAMATAGVLGDVHAMEAARIDYRAALEATSFGDWPTRIEAGALQSAPAQRRSSIGNGSHARCVLNLLMQHASEPQLGDHAAAARAAWQDLADADPQAAHAAANNPEALDRLALRLPWRGAALEPITRWLARMPRPVANGAAFDDEAAVPMPEWLRDAQRLWLSRWRDGGSAGEQGLPPLPDAEAVLAPYRQLAGDRATPRAVVAVAQRALACGAGTRSVLELQWRLIVERIPAALAAAARLPQLDMIDARQAQWTEPLLARHAQSLRTALAEVHSVTEVELVSAHADACLDIEADWNRLLMTSLLAPMQAAAMVAVFGADAELGLQRAARVSHALLGLGPRALLHSPALAHFLAKRLLPAVDTAGEHGSVQGEAGRELLAPLRGWLAMRGAAGAPLAGARSLAAACLELLDRCAVAEPEPVERPLVLWGRSASVLHWDQLIATSSRPPLPGWSAMGDRQPPL